MATAPRGQASHPETLLGQQRSEYPVGFDFSSEERRKLGYHLIDRIDQYFSTLNNRAVQPPAEERTVVQTPHPLPELGSDASQVLDDLCREMIDRGFHIPAANYFGLMNPTPT